jgi:uncharacterized protein (TIGR02246 family)
VTNCRLISAVVGNGKAQIAKGGSMESDEQEIRQLVATWMSATKSGDNEKVLNLMAEDVVFLIPGQPPMRGKSAFATGQSALQQVDIDGQSEIQEIKVFGDWAYLWSKLSVTITPKSSGAPIKRSGNTLSILQKQSGKWVLYRDANLLAVDSQ